MSAIIDPRDRVRQLDRPSEPDENVTEEDAGKPRELVKLLMRMLRDIALLKRRWWPRRIDFEDRAVTGTGTVAYRFTHGFDGRVRWWVVDWLPDNPGDNFQLERVASTDNKTLVLNSNVGGVLTLRVEEAG
jgi:hypothetical protein